MSVYVSKTPNACLVLSSLVEALLVLHPNGRRCIYIDTPASPLTPFGCVSCQAVPLDDIKRWNLYDFGDGLRAICPGDRPPPCRVWPLFAPPTT
ncbi:hypothetical protein V1517DRAFT_325012 [Lipomyces orientalis]|uniref:Uncharacterized protein n=1 Tax=Lipomyces orientalis TaxID=1233043 RepID=A0ACC3TLY2_9ASCO